MKESSLEFRVKFKDKFWCNEIIFDDLSSVLIDKLGFKRHDALPVQSPTSNMLYLNLIFLSIYLVFENVSAIQRLVNINGVITTEFNTKLITVLVNSPTLEE